MLRFCRKINFFFFSEMEYLSNKWESNVFTDIVCFRFQDVESDTNLELEPTPDEMNREQNNNSMFQQNLENHQNNEMINSR